MSLAFVAGVLAGCQSFVLPFNLYFMPSPNQLASSAGTWAEWVYVNEINECLVEFQKYPPRKQRDTLAGFCEAVKHDLRSPSELTDCGKLDWIRLAAHRQPLIYTTGELGFVTVSPTGAIRMKRPFPWNRKARFPAFADSANLVGRLPGLVSRGEFDLPAGPEIRFQPSATGYKPCWQWAEASLELMPTPPSLWPDDLYRLNDELVNLRTVPIAEQREGIRQYLIRAHRAVWAYDRAGKSLTLSGLGNPWDYGKLNYLCLSKGELDLVPDTSYGTRLSQFLAVSRDGRISFNAGTERVDNVQVCLREAQFPRLLKLAAEGRFDLSAAPPRVDGPPRPPRHALGDAPAPTGPETCEGWARGKSHRRRSFQDRPQRAPP